MDSPLCGTSLDGNQLQDFLKLSNQIDLEDHFLIKVKGELLVDQGFACKLIRVWLTWNENLDTLPKSVIVKVIGGDGIDQLFNNKSKYELNKLKEDFDISYSVECAVYGLEELPHFVPMPKCYYAIPHTERIPGIIILEDLLNSTCVFPKMNMFNRGLNPNQIEQVLQALTSLHAWSVNTKEPWTNCIPTQSENPAIPEASEFRCAALSKSKQLYPEYLGKLSQIKASQLVNKRNYLRIFGCDPVQTYQLPLVLVHGDVTLMNLMFERELKREGCGDRLVAFIDWQLAHQGCGVEDLNRLFQWCLSTTIRRQKGHEIIKRYVELFNSKVEKTTNQITFENVKRALNDMFAFTGIMYGCALSLLTSYASRFGDLRDNEREIINKRLLTQMLANYNDAMSILHW